MLFLLPGLWGVFLIRDRLLIRRIRRIFDQRGKCPQCSYNLIGLPVGADVSVTCPECDSRVRVDPAMGELSAGPDGSSRYQPSERALLIDPDPARIARRRRRWRLALVIFGFSIILLGVVVRIREASLRTQAEAALTARPTRDDVESAIRKHTAVIPARDVPRDRFGALVDVEKLILQASDAARTDDPGAFYGTGLAEFVRRAKLPGADAENGLHSSEERLGALSAINQIVDRALNAELRSALREVGQRVSTLPEPSVGGDLTLMTYTYASETTRTNVVSLCVALMNRADASADAGLFAEAVDAGLAALADGHDGGSLFSVGQYEAEASAFLRAAMDMAARRPSGEWIDSLSASSRKHRLELSRALSFEIAQLSALDVAAQVFSDPNNVRFGKWSGRLNGLDFIDLAKAGKGRLGTFEEQRAQILAVYAPLIAAGDAPTIDLPFPVVPPDPSLISLSFWQEPSSLWFRRTDPNRLTRRGILVEIALESARRADGSYPESLEALVPRFLDAVPEDPIEGGPLRYLRHGPDAFTLYSVGNDGIDNAGTPPSADGNGLGVLESGVDHILARRPLPAPKPAPAGPASTIDR
ncbi:MAG: hypothetical protein ACT4PL_14535 [Phycisphaerales bacterium]